MTEMTTCPTCGALPCDQVTPAAALRQSPSVEEVARVIDDAPDEWGADELAQAIANLYAGREG